MLATYQTLRAEKRMIWTILGVSVAVVALFCISVAETLVGRPIFEDHRAYIAGVLVVAGVSAWFIGRHLADKRGLPASEETEQTGRHFVLFDLRYWGPMFVALGLITLFIRPLREQKIEKPIAVKPAPPKPKPVVVAKVEEPKPEPPKPKAPAVFPEVKVQGIIYRTDRRFAILNGDSYSIGDQIGGARVAAIDQTRVVLELEGEFKMLTLN
jgi:hypothetical protein